VEAGKSTCVERGAFDGAHWPMMVAPLVERAPRDLPAVSHFDVHSRVDAAHASAPPGRASTHRTPMTIAHVAIGCSVSSSAPATRSTARPPRTLADQHHSLGGERTVMCGLTLEALESSTQVKRCFERAPRHRRPVSPMRSSRRCTRTWRATSTPRRLRQNAEPGSQVRRRHRATAPTLSTDMANICSPSPPYHPLMAIDPTARSTHQPEFTAACITPSAEPGGLRRCAGHGWTTVDAATNRRSGTDCWAWAMILEHAVLEVRPARPAFRQPSPRPSNQSPPPRAAGRPAGTLRRSSGPLLLLSSGSRSRRTVLRDSAAYGQWRALLHHFYRPFPSSSISRPSTGVVVGAPQARPHNTRTASNVAVP